MQSKGASPRVKKNEKLADFGTYHYTTPQESAKEREQIKLVFMQAFRNLPFSREQKLKVLDVGCGLGFLACACVEFYPNALVTGIDTFEHSSLKGSSLAKARKNAKLLGFANRIKFQKGDIFGSNYREGKFNLFVSNLVFHNFGKKRFDAYTRLASWTSPGSYVLLGDLMFSYEADLKHVSRLFNTIEGIPATEAGGNYMLFVMSEPSGKDPTRTKRFR